jgi:hypothetical protein
LTKPKENEEKKKEKRRRRKRNEKGVVVRHYVQRGNSQFGVFKTPKLCTLVLLVKVGRKQPKTDIQLGCTGIFTFHLTENTTHLHYKD